jgi:hypothetical protein
MRANVHFETTIDRHLSCLLITEFLIIIENFQQFLVGTFTLKGNLNLNLIYGLCSMIDYPLNDIFNNFIATIIKLCNQLINL